MIQVTFTSRRAKTIDNPNDIEPTVYKYADSRCPRGSNEYKILDAAIIELHPTHTIEEIMKATDVYKWRVQYRIRFLLRHGYIQSKIKLHLTKGQKNALKKQITANKKAIEAASAKLNRAAQYMAITAYDIGILIDGEENIIKIDDTYPAVNNWETATTFALQLIMRKHGDCDIEFLFCKDYPSEEYKKYGYIHETPIRLQ